jgi:hypothetical protein
MKTKAEKNLEKLNKLLNIVTGFALAWLLFAIILLSGAIK